MDQFVISADIDGFLLLQHLRCGSKVTLGLDVTASELMDAIMDHRCAS